MVTGGIDPTDQGDGLADMGLAEFVAVVGTHGKVDKDVINHRWTG
jgi:hypothetical protein